MKQASHRPQSSPSPPHPWWPHPWRPPPPLPSPRLLLQPSQRGPSRPPPPHYKTIPPSSPTSLEAWPPTPAATPSVAPSAPPPPPCRRAHAAPHQDRPRRSPHCRRDPPPSESQPSAGRLRRNEYPLAGRGRHRV